MISDNLNASIFGINGVYVYNMVITSKVFRFSALFSKITRLIINTRTCLQAGK